MKMINYITMTYLVVVGGAFWYFEIYLDNDVEVLVIEPEPSTIKWDMSSGGAVAITEVRLRINSSDTTLWTNFGSDDK